MFLNNSISDLLKKDRSLLIKATKSPNLMRSIGAVALDKTKRYIVATIGNFQPKVFYDENNEIKTVSCDCGSSDPRCGHIAHLLIHLKKMSDQEFEKSIKDNVIDASTETLINSILTLENNSEVGFSGHRFTTTDPEVLRKFIKNKIRYIKERAVNAYFALKKDNIIALSIYDRIYSGENFMAEILLERENEFLRIKSCEIEPIFGSFNLENQLINVLSHEVNLQILTNKDWYDYEKIVKSVSTQSKISEADIKVFYTIYLGENGRISLAKEVESYLETNTIKSLLDFSELKAINRNTQIGEILKITSQRDHLFTNVILWPRVDEKSSYYFLLGKAKLNKAKNKLSSSFSLTSKPEYWDENQRTFFKGLENVKSKLSAKHLIASQLAQYLSNHQNSLGNTFHAIDIMKNYRSITEYNINDINPFSFSESVMEIHVEIREANDKYALIKYYTIGDQKFIFYDGNKEEELEEYANDLLSYMNPKSAYKIYLAQLPKYDYDRKKNGFYGSYYGEEDNNDEYDDDEYDDDDIEEAGSSDISANTQNQSNGSLIDQYIAAAGLDDTFYFISTSHHYMNAGFGFFNNQGFIYANPNTQALHRKIDSIQIFDKTKENLEVILDALEGIIEVTLPDATHVEVVALQSPRYELYLSESEDYIQFKPVIKYQDDIEIILPVEAFSLHRSEGESFVRYDISEEDVLMFTQFLDDVHPSLSASNEQTGQYYLHINILLENAWFLDFFEQCHKHKIVIFGQENLTKFKFNQHKAQIKVGISSGIDWFDVNVDIKYGKTKVQLKSWIDAVKNNQKFIQLSDGSLGLLPTEWVEKLKTLAKITKKDGENLVVSKYNFALLDQHFDSEIDAKLRKVIHKKIQTLQDFDAGKKYALPSTLQADLRPYQMEGYQWLKSLDELNFGGCLADDMGLGKTLQILSFFADQVEKKAGTCLVVVPKSLLFNWDAEIKKFCPSLRHLTHHGGNRVSSKDGFVEYDLVITTYDTATSDIEWLKDVKFHYIVLDESQAIKNPASQRYKAMRLLQASNRFVMTGTPIENNTFDLFAQFSFINPGIFGSANNFREEFAIPIDKQKDEQSSLLLQKMVKPFLLRRTKAQVATDLPERVENIIYCEMGPAQKSYYEAMKNEVRQELISTAGQGDFSKSKLKVIEGLLRLRQICNSPKLIHPTISKDTHISVKIDTLMDIIENELGDHNALIFSQFTSMLALIRKALDDRQIRYAYLDGSTQNRKAAVQEFEDHDDIKLFLISLKAGNTGLNLTKADYVYIVDPWWNPAVEAQAIDRTHRIGQTKNVFAYKLVCKDTIEEKIIQLQASKKTLSDSIISTDENVFNALDKDELLALFK
jgi:SNF2-related domain/Helicase conserved C-terminal domain